MLCWVDFKHVFLEFLFRRIILRNICRASVGLNFWNALLDAGSDYGVMPYGTEALHVMRAEKGFIMIGDETDGTIIPQDLNLNWAISKKKNDFIGKRAHERIFMRNPIGGSLLG